TLAMRWAARGVANGLLVFAFVPSVFVSSTACSDLSCANVESGSGVEVRWSPNELPPDATPSRMCVNGACEGVSAVHLYGTKPDMVAAWQGSSPPRMHVRMRLELVDATGHRVAVFRGEGQRSGRCCPSVGFRPTATGSLAVDRGQT